MQVSQWIIFGAAEVLGVLLLICGFLLFYARNLKKLAVSLQQKLQLALRELKKSRKRCKELEAQTVPSASYTELVDEQLESTKKHHLSLQPDRDIALDLSSDTPAPRQVASLRHAFLNSEKEAVLGSEQAGEPNWDILQVKLQRLMEFFHAEADDGASSESDISIADLEELQQALAISEQRVANLEKFKTLYFDLEDKWEAVQQQAETYQQELQGFEVAGIGKQAQFNAMLQAYQNNYQDFGAQLPQSTQLQDPAATGPGGAASATAVDKPKVSPAGNQVAGPHPSVEIQRPQSVAASQHKLITELQQRLARAYSSLEKEAIIKDLKGQLQEQLNYVDESKACLDNMEQALDSANSKLKQLQRELEGAELTNQQNAQILSEAKALKAERSKIKQALAKLQAENEQLVRQLKTVMTGTGDTSGNPQAQKDLQHLQQQYVDLENKYLALRMKSQ